jgi:splicing factor 3B subunit 3
MPHFVAISLNRPSGINATAYGSFSGAKTHELAVAKGTSLDLLRPDESGKLVSLCHLNCFSVIRSLLAFRLLGSSKDYLVVGTDSGKITIMEYNITFGRGSWTTVHCETFGKTGCRRVVPGQYLCCDPKGRAVMVGAVEKQRFVYVLNRDGDNKLTISSPLEAHRAESILFSCVGLDVGLENPVFACLEMEYAEADADPTAAADAEKTLTLYELDLGLNHVVRKWCEPVSRLANFLLAVPGGDDGPGGVLICGENWISYRNQDHAEVRTPLPRRMDLPLTRGSLVTAGVLHKQKGMFFFLVQTELGDVFKVTLAVSDNSSKAASSSSTSMITTTDKVVTDVIVSVFDSIRVTTSLCITRSGLLFAASEHSNHKLYQFQALGDDAECVRASRCDDDNIGDDAESAASVAPLFKPSRKLANLVELDDISSLAPVTSMMVETGEENQGLITGGVGTDGTTTYGSSSFGSGSGADATSLGLRIHTLCGKGNHSTLRILRHGSSVSEMARSELPGKPTALWTIKGNSDDRFDKYIVVSFSNATIVLSVGDTVEEVTTTGFLLTACTLGVALLDDNTILQVHPGGVRHIKAGNKVVEWKTPGQRPVSRAIVNSRQAVVAVDKAAKGGGLATELIYFELDAAGQLSEESSLELDTDITDLDMGEAQSGRTTFPFCAIGQVDDTVTVLSLDRSDLLQQRAVMQLTARPDSLKFVDLSGTASGTGDGALSLNIGLQSGVLVRVAVDRVSGSLSDSRQRFLGVKPLKLARVLVDGTPGLLALTNKTWIMYSLQGSFYQAPIAYDALDIAQSFASESCPGGIIACAGKSLRIFSVDDLGTMFSQQTVPLSYTPRHMVRVPYSSLVVTIETDHNEYNEQEKQLLSQLADSMAMATDDGAAAGGGGGGSGENANANEDEGDEDEGTKGPPLRGPVPELDGKWASCVRVLDSSTGRTVHQLELGQNQAAVSMCACTFYQHSQELFIAVGVASGLLLHPRSSQSAAVQIYRFVDDGRLELVHSTEVESPPSCMAAFQGRLLVGVGRVLRMYDLGKKLLLKKCESRPLPVGVARIATSGDRIFAGDVVESVYFLKYSREANTLCTFAEDEVPRYITSLCALDYDSVAAGDKFGNFFVLRVPEDIDDTVDDSPARMSLWDTAKRAKVLLEAHYYLGDAITSIQKSSLAPEGKEVLLASTVSGGLFAFSPCSYQAEYSFFEQLQLHVRKESSNSCGRDHRAFRSLYQPTRNVVDGDLCEQYQQLPFDVQVAIAQELDRNPLEIGRKLEEMRSIL